MLSPAGVVEAANRPKPVRKVVSSTHDLDP